MRSRQPTTAITVTAAIACCCGTAAAGTITTVQYADLGVIFTDANDTVVCCRVGSFAQDGAGLDGNISVEFHAPQFWIAVDHPGSMRLQLFRAGEPAYMRSVFHGGQTGIDFDRVVLSALGSDAHIDDLHFDAPVPGVGALPVLLAAGLHACHRRGATAAGRTG